MNTKKDRDAFISQSVPVRLSRMFHATWQCAMVAEGKTRREALQNRLKVRRQGKDAELDRREAGEAERREAHEDLVQLEEFEFEVRHSFGF